MVRGLQRLCKNFIPNSTKPLNILESIKKFKIENGEDPTIGICLESWLSQIPLKDTLLGNRYYDLCQKFESLLKQLNKAGCNVVSFLHVPVDKVESFCEMKQSQYVFKTQLFDMMEAEPNLDLLEAKIVKYTQNIDSFKSCNKDYIMMLAGIAKKYGKVVKLFSNEKIFHKLSYLKVFNQKNVLAVIAFDSDFLLYEGKWQYWSSKHLNIKDMTTVVFDKEEVLKYLRLSLDQVPMFHALIRESGLFNKSHNIVYRSIRKYTQFENHWYENIGPFITDHPVRTFSQLQAIKRALFKKQTAPTSFISNLQKSLRYFTYSNEEIINNQQNNIVQEQYKKIDSELILEILHQWTTYIRYVMPDFRDPVFLKMTELIVVLLRRVGGVVLKAANHPFNTVTINLKRDHELWFKTEEFSVLEPTFEVPTIDQIVSGSVTDSQKYQMLLFITELDLTESQLKSVDTEKMLKIITLSLMIKAKLLDQQESVGILKTLVEQKQCPENVIYPERVNIRCHRVCCLLFEVYSLFQRCLEAIGFEPCQFNMYMDGVYFHNLMFNNFPTTEATTENWENDSTIFNQLLEYA